MSFEQPAPDLARILTAWESWEKGEEAPGRVLSEMKTAGLATILQQLSDEAQPAGS